MAAFFDWSNMPQKYRIIRDAWPDAPTDKTYTVPALTTWDILHCIVYLKTSEAVGDRNLAVRRMDASGAIVWTGFWVATFVPANFEARYWLLPGGNIGTMAVANQRWYLLPLQLPTLLQAGEALRVLENQGIDPLGDHLLVSWVVREIT